MQVKQRIVWGLAAFFLILHLSLTVWSLVDSSAAAITGRLQMPAMLLFSLLHASYLLGWRRALAFFILSAVVSWGFEQAGVATGWVYGRYHYADQLGVKLGHVPLIIPFIWFMMLYPSYVIANLIGDGRAAGPQGRLRHILWLSFLGAMAMTAWDLAVDPIFTQLGFWIWEDGGPYFGVPLHNFAGWLATTFTIYLLYRLWEQRVGRRPFGPITPLITWMPPLIYGSQALGTFVRPELGIIVFFAMGFPLVTAVGRYQKKQ